jgi:hypothetical protein
MLFAPTIADELDPTDNPPRNKSDKIGQPSYVHCKIIVHFCRINVTFLT